MTPNLQLSTELFDRAPWLRIAAAEIGVTEVAGEKDNPRIQEYLAVCGLHVHDETPWCSAFVNWVLKQAGYAITGKANARSWLGYGGPLSLSYPLFPGAVTVFSRPGSDGKPSTIFGHVAFLIEQKGDQIIVLGGNQGNRVCVAPYAKNRLLGYRWPFKSKPVGVPTNYPPRPV